MTAGELAAELRLIANRGGPFGSDTEDAIVELARLLDLHSDSSIEAIAKLLTPKAPRAQGPKAPAKPTVLGTPVSDEVVVRYLDALSTTTDMDAQIATIKADKAVSKAVAEELAIRFLGIERKYTKKAAIEAIHAHAARAQWDKDAIEHIGKRV